MKAHKLISITSMFLMASVCVLLPPTVAFAQSEFAYAYLMINQNGSAQLQNVSQVDTRPTPVVIPNGRQAPFEVVVNPQGQWIVLPLLATDQQDYLVQILNPQSGEYRDVAQGLLAGQPIGFLGSAQNIVWSPDGRYLALNLASRDELSRDDLDILLYSLEDGVLTDLSQDQIDQFRLAWSPDTTRIATSTEDCSRPNQPCILHLEVFSASRQSREASIDVSFLSRGSAVLGSSVCDITWSPDGRYLSFVSVCNSTVPQFPMEVYVWDTFENKVVQATNFTTEAANRSQGAIIRGTYDTVWTDAQTLVVSAATQINTEPVSIQTIAYNVSEMSSTALSSIAAHDLELNPISGQLAFQMIDEAENITDVYQTSEPIRITPPDVSASEGLAATDSNSSLTAPTGCDLKWSPDGNTLAFTIRANGDCRARIERIVFLDAITGETQEHVIPTDPSIARIVPIGWVAG